MQFSGDLISHGRSHRRANTCFTIHTNITLLSRQITNRSKSEFSNFCFPVLLIQESLASPRKTEVVRPTTTPQPPTPNIRRNGRRIGHLMQ